MYKKISGFVLSCFLISTSLVAQVDLSSLEKTEFYAGRLNLDRPSKVLIPSTAEIFVAMDNLGFNPKVFWKDLSKYNENTKYDSRYALALNVGVRVTDAFVAIQHQDQENFSKMSQAIVTMTQQLGVEEVVLSHSEVVRSYLKQNPPDWFGVRGRIEEMRSAVICSLIDLDDEEILTLITIGGWIKGLHVYSKAVERYYTKDAAALLKQPYLVDYYKKRIKRLSEDAKNLESIKKLVENIDDLSAIVDVEPEKSISKKEIKILREVSSKITKLIEKGK